MFLFLPDENTWKFINTFAPWFSAIGTLAAVSTSLYLAFADRTKLTISILPTSHSEPLKVLVENNRDQGVMVQCIYVRIGKARANLKVLTNPTRIAGRDVHPFDFPFKDVDTHVEVAMVKTSKRRRRKIKLGVQRLAGKRFEVTVKGYAEERIQSKVKEVNELIRTKRKRSPNRQFRFP